LRKIIKSSNAGQANTFRLHYFPNIPARTEAATDNHGNNAPAAPAAPGEAGQFGPGAARGGGRSGSAQEQTHLEDIAKQAYAEGFAQGERDAKALADQRVAPLVATLENMLAELSDARQRLQQQIENEVVDLALHIGRKLVGQTLQASPDVVTGIVHEALKQVEDSEKISIRLNPADAQRLHQLSDRHDLNEKFDRIQLVEDSAITSGGCLVQTDYGEIDARIEEQFRTIEEAFRAERMGLAIED
jgi:flagellar assembly protein FliH